MVMSKQDKTDYKRKFNEENYSRVGLYLKEDVKKALDAHRAKTGESMNALINRAIMEIIKNETSCCDNDVFGTIPNYSGTAIYALVDDQGKKYIGSSTDLKRRLLFHASHVKTLLRDGNDGFLCSKMQEAILAGRKFRVEVLEMLPSEISKEELNNKEYYWLEKEGGLEATYNMKPIKQMYCQPGDILEHVEERK